MRFIKKVEDYSNGYSAKTNQTRKSDRFYRDIYSYERKVRSTHGVNCTGSCSWEIFVKNGFVVREMQQIDYPETREDIPNYEPRGCARGASYSWYLYSGSRVKYPLIRASLLKQWREEKEKTKDPVEAWGNIVKDLKKTYKKERGRGGMVRATWSEVEELIVASNIFTIKEYGPDRIFGFSPIPAMSMLSYAAGSRYLSLIGGFCMSFYDWYCDLPPASPQTWGEQTDVSESAAWYDSTYIIVWGSNVPLTRTPDAHFLTEVRYKGTKVVAVTPDYSEVSKLADTWLNPKFGTDAAMGMAMIHVVLKEFFYERPSKYFLEYVKKYTDLPFKVKLEKRGDGYVPCGFLLADDFEDKLGQSENAEWKPVFYDGKKKKLISPEGSIGHRWQSEKGSWRLDVDADPVLISESAKSVNVAFPDFSVSPKAVFERKVFVDEVEVKEGKIYVATVFDLLSASMGINKDNAHEDTYNDKNLVNSPAWQEAITEVPREKVIAIAKEFAWNAEKTEGRSMIIVGAGVNHWFNTDMTYRSIIYLLMLTGCIGKPGGGWSHYVGQEKLRPAAGWANVAFALDWNRPPRQINSTSFFYAHSDQWRYEKVFPSDILSPLANNEDEWSKKSLLDCNLLAERLGWLPAAPHFGESTLNLVKDAKQKNMDVKEYVVKRLKDKSLLFANEDVDAPANFPKNMFIWRSNLMGSSSKGHEYMLKHLLGTDSNEIAEDQVEVGKYVGEDEKLHQDAPIGKLDLLVTLDFRMSTTCVYSDIVLPSATWYEKEDVSTSDMHPFIHPFTKAVDPCWESRTDWDIFKGLAKKFSEVSKGRLGKETDLVVSPLMHDSPAEISQPRGKVLDWRKNEVEPIPGKTMPNLVLVERDYPNVYKQYTSLGPLIEKAGSAVKGIAWDAKSEVEYLKNKNGEVSFQEMSLAKMETVREAIDAVLSLAPETNGHVAKKAWQALEKTTGRNFSHIYAHKEQERVLYEEIVGRPKKVISSPVWSGVEAEEICYVAGYTNVYENIPWRTLTGRQHFYLDHQWSRDFGNSLANYKPAIDLKNIERTRAQLDENEKHLLCTLSTAHQKWGIHSSFSDNLLMLTLGRGGTCVWLNEDEALSADIQDNDWVELFNDNGSVIARVVVSQRIPKQFVMYCHAQEKTVNNPLSPRRGLRGGMHNSLIKTVLNPMHMIGGYAQLSWSFNYYGTIGCNREETVIIRKLNKIDWS